MPEITSIVQVPSNGPIAQEINAARMEPLALLRTMTFTTVLKARSLIAPARHLQVHHQDLGQVHQVHHLHHLHHLARHHQAL